MARVGTKSNITLLQGCEPISFANATLGLESTSNRRQYKSFDKVAGLDGPGHGSNLPGLDIPIWIFARLANDLLAQLRDHHIFDPGISAYDDIGCQRGYSDLSAYELDNKTNTSHHDHLGFGLPVLAGAILLSK